ncbi:hypothetical protein J5X07_08125 [Actinomyces bowdenii]|uniref:DUF6301 family protein n=1 Tax=Actinomyces bowdenii TaxID=131109 RepID=UPI001ABC99E2|nr:DUF6301 family protein [Actinomyces bowdenii]MBO3724992.1 hypothetical protein [Actinomyces bowdenii]
MSDFRTLPVEEAIAWIRAWTDHTWPISLQEAFAIRDHLDWRPSSQDPTLFATRLSNDGKEDGFILESSESGVKCVRFHLSSKYPSDDNVKVAQLSSAAYSQYVAALTQLWSHGESSEEFGVLQVSWTLPNRTSVSIFGLDNLISVTIDSPWRTQLKEDYDQVMEDYE